LDAISAKLPTEKTKEQQALRKRLFSEIDGNGNGLLSLAELDLGILKTLKCEEI
jgi:hypothetical protein